jgi:hypothetical protein
MLELTETETHDILIGRIPSLGVGDTLALPNGYVRRVKPREFVLHADANKDRARWGTCSEITDDVRIFLTTGLLPKALGGRW